LALHKPVESLVDDIVFGVLLHLINGVNHILTDPLRPVVRRRLFVSAFNVAPTLVLGAFLILYHLDIPESFEDLHILNMVTHLFLEVLLSLGLLNHLTSTELCEFWVAAAENTLTHHIDESDRLFSENDVGPFETE
jgi:hypothetical protein